MFLKEVNDQLYEATLLLKHLGIFSVLVVFVYFIYSQGLIALISISVLFPIEAHRLIEARPLCQLKINVWTIGPNLSQRTK